MTEPACPPVPSRASELIRMALRDLAACEQDPRYRVEMMIWHAFDVTKRACMVCLAGSVMAKTLQIPLDMDCYLNMFPQDWGNALAALDCFRCGHVHAGLQALDYSSTTRVSFPSHIEMFPYHTDPERFKQALTDLADKFEQAGI